MEKNFLCWGRLIKDWVAVRVGDLTPYCVPCEYVCHKLYNKHKQMTFIVIYIFVVRVLNWQNTVQRTLLLLHPFSWSCSWDIYNKSLAKYDSLCLCLSPSQIPESQNTAGLLNICIRIIPVKQDGHSIINPVTNKAMMFSMFCYCAGPACGVDDLIHHLKVVEYCWLCFQ